VGGYHLCDYPEKTVNIRIKYREDEKEYYSTHHQMVGPVIAYWLSEINTIFSTKNSEKSACYEVILPFSKNLSDYEEKVKNYEIQPVKIEPDDDVNAYRILNLIGKPPF